MGMEWRVDVMLHVAAAVWAAQLRGPAPRERKEHLGHQHGALILPPAEPCRHLALGARGRHSSADASRVKKRGQRQPGLWAWEMSGLLPRGGPWKVTSEQLLHRGTPPTPKGKATAPSRDHERHTHAQIHPHAHTHTLLPLISNTSDGGSWQVPGWPPGIS